MRPSRRSVFTSRSGLVVAALFAFGLAAYHSRSILVIVSNRSDHPVDRVTLHLLSQHVTLGRMAPGETRRTRIWPTTDGGLTLTLDSGSGTRHASLSYIYPWHGPFKGVLTARVAADSVVVRQRLGRSRPLIPRWVEYSSPLRRE